MIGDKHHKYIDIIIKDAHYNYTTIEEKNRYIFFISMAELELILNKYIKHISYKILGITQNNAHRLGILIEFIKKENI